MSVGVGGACAALGLLLGPFLAGLTIRVPAEDRLLSAGWWRGAPASGRRIGVVTALAAVVLGGLGAAVGAAAELPAYLWLGAVGVVLAVVDVDCHRLPDRLTLPSYPVGVVLLGVASIAEDDLGAWLRALIAMAVVFAVFFAFALASPRSLGFGDVKLAGLLGLYLGWLGWEELVFGLLCGFCVGAAVALTLLAGRRVGWRSDVAFGPSLLAGGLVAVVIGQQVLDAYLGSVGLAAPA